MHEKRLALTSRLDDTQKTGGGGQALLRQQRHRPLVQLPIRHESHRSRRLRQRPLNDRPAGLAATFAIRRQRQPLCAAEIRSRSVEAA